MIRRRILFPIEALEQAMLGLAQGRLDAPLPDAKRYDEMSSMADALRVFKANAIRRARLQNERIALHDRLEESYRQVRADLEAAAGGSGGPSAEPGRMNGISYCGHYRPAHFIAGDTYNVICLPDGRAIFFLIDVAGHGAPAALVSVASHYSLVQTLISHQPQESIAEAVERLNDEWPENMPYFTMVLGEIEPSSGRGRLVQAGHPAPILVHRNGRSRLLGDGGLPIGVISGASFEEVPFDFSPGDRLLVYSDGLTEAENEREEAFKEDRLDELVRQHASDTIPIMLKGIEHAVRSWRGARKLEDDLTVLILEAERQE